MQVAWEGQDTMMLQPCGGTEVPKPERTRAVAMTVLCPTPPSQALLPHLHHLPPLAPSRYPALGTVEMLVLCGPRGRQQRSG